MILHCSLLVLSLFVCPVAPGQSEPTLPELLARAREQQNWESDTQLSLKAGVTFTGVEESAALVFAGDGRFRQVFEGKLYHELRFDGDQVREAENGALWQDLEFFARETALLRAWVHGGYWLEPQAPLSIRLAEDAFAVTEQVQLVLRVDGGLLDATLTLDRAKMLVRSLTFQTGSGELCTDYSQHAPLAGHWLARTVRSDVDLGSECILQVESVKLAELGDSPFEPLADRPDYRFDSSVEARVEVKRSKSNHMFVRALIGGEDLGLFFFDTGAGFSGISKEAADALGMDAFGQVSMTGMGGEVSSTQLRRGGSLQLGPLTIDDLVYTEISVERKSRMMGEKVAGVLGWDVMRRVVLEMEPGSAAIRLHDPATFKLEEADWSPLHLHYRVPYISAKFAPGNEGLFMLDSGAAGVTVLLFHHAAKALDLLSSEGGPESTGRGGGGEFQHRPGELEWFELCKDRLSDVPIVLSTAEDGETDPYSLGLIGGGLLRNKRVLFDYSRKRVAILDE